MFEAVPITINRRAVMAVVVAMAAINALSTDLYLPSLPALRLAFGATAEQVQATLGAYLAGSAASYLVFGVLADRFGRRRPILAGLTIYFISSLGLLLTPWIELLVALRFLQGFGATVGGVLGVLVIRDLFVDDSAATWMGHRAAAVTLSFLFAPLLGGWLETTFGWQASFVFMTAFGCILLIATWFGLAETSQRLDTRALHLGRILSNVALLLGSRRFIGYLLVQPLLFGGFFAFIATAPFIYIEQLGLTPTVLGLVFMLHSAGFFIGLQLARPINRRYGLDRTIVLGTIIGTLSGLVMLALALAGQITVSALSGPIVGIMFGLGMVNPNATVRGVNLYPQVAGLASALQGTSMFAMAALATWLVGRLPAGTIPLALTVLPSAGLAAVIFVTTVGIGRQEEAPPVA